MHGRLSPIRHDAGGLFAGLPQDFLAGRYHSLVVGAVPPELRVTAWTPDGVIMGLEHRSRPLFGVQFHPESVSTRHGRELLENFRARTPRRRRRAVAPRTEPAPPPPPERVQLRHRRLEAWCEPEAVFAALYADRDHAVWLDSWRSGAGVARFSFVGVPDGPLGQVVRYDVGTRTVEVERASGVEARAESVFDYCRAELERLRVDAPELPFDFVGGFAGYFGFELKAECGGRLTHPSPLPDAAFVLCDRLIAFDYRERRVHLVALTEAGSSADADAWLDATADRLRALAREPPPVPPEPAPAGTLQFALYDSPEAYLEHIAACKREIFEGRELRDLSDDGAAQRGHARPCAGVPGAARAQPGPVRRPATPRRALRPQLVAGAVPARRSRPRRRVAADEGDGRAGRRAVRGRLRRRRAAPGPQDPRREPHDRRPRAQRPRPRVAARHRRGPEAHGGRVARHRPPDGDRGPRPAARRRRCDRLRPRRVPRRFDDGRAEAAHARDHRSSRGPRPRRLLRRARLLAVNGTADLNVVIRTLVAAPGGLTIGAGGAIVAGSEPEAELDEMLLKARALLQALGGTLDAVRRGAVAAR